MEVVGATAEGVREWYSEVKSMFRLSFRLRSLVPLLSAVLLTFPCVAASNGPQKNPHRPTAPAVTPLVAPPRSLLPTMFADWQLTGTPQESTDPQTADPSDAAVLNEYGFTRFEAANYTRDGETLALKAMEFGDATGAYGAYTFYRRPQMAPEQIGQGGAFDGSRVLFWSGIVLVDAKFEHVTPMSAAELRDLVTLLPQPTGNQGVLPTLPQYLPPQRMQPDTAHYSIGPDAYRLSGGVLPPGIVGFNDSAEVVSARYDSMNGPGTLTIINYPTPEIAIEKQHAIQAYFASHGASAGKPGQPQYPWTQALAESNPAALQTRRSGPLLAITSGSFTADVARNLLQRVHYEVNLTVGNYSRYVPDTAKIAQLIISVALLVGIFAVIAIVAAVSLGGGRVMWRKMRAKSGVPEDDSAEFIRLNLRR